MTLFRSRSTSFVLFLVFICVFIGKVRPLKSLRCEKKNLYQISFFMEKFSIFFPPGFIFVCVLRLKTSDVLTLTFCGVVRHWTSQCSVINNNWQYKQETLLQSVFKFDIKSEIQLAAPLTPVTTLSLSS